ncbi:MAG: NAD(P)/FAD-dependent oxidoreductase [Erysipelotrichaceae bacterium]|nr:NAD(P)/FAD-dependent oxidoreductase [Erysipelotrichaceae bacterium]
MERYDCLVIGAGIAGITAGIYLKRSNLSCLVLDKDAPGGKLNNIHRIDNYPGVARIAGPELAMSLFNQANDLGVVFDYGAVSEVRKENCLFLVKTDVNSYEAKSLIVATGIENKKLGVPGEAEYSGKGVSYCATCDGNFFKGMPVVVYGYKDHAVEDAIYLSGLASHVYVLAPQELETTQAHREELLRADNLTLLEGAKLLQAKGEGKLQSVTYELNGEQHELETAALFQLNGEKSSSMFLSSLGVKTNKGFIEVGPNMETNVPGLFAAGDVLDKKLRQLVNAAGEASVAATMAIAYVHSLKA